MVDGDRQAVVIGVPKELEQQFGLGAGIDEDDGGVRLGDLGHDFGYGVLRHKAGIGHGLFRLEDRHLRGLSRRRAVEMRYRVTCRTQPVAEDLRLCHRRRQADAAEARREALQLRQGQGDQVAALRRRHLVDLVDDHGLQRRKHLPCLGIGQQEEQAFRRGQQDVRRLLPLALAAVLRGVAGAAFDAYRQVERVDHRRDIAFDIVI